MMSTNARTLILEVPCFEKRGLVMRKVWIIRPDQSDVGWIFERLRGLPSMFSSIELVSHKQLEKLFDKSITYLLVDDVGMMSVGSSIVSIEGVYHVDVHIVFWDRVLRGREELCRRAAQWAANYRYCGGVWTPIPTSSKTVIAFAKRVGFEAYDYRPDVTTDRDGLPDDLILMRYTV
jgi:hypothetical protein